MPYKGKLAFNRYCTQIPFTIIKATKKKKKRLREKGKWWHTQVTTPSNLGDALWHPYYSFPLIRFCPLASSFWFLKLMVSLLVKTPKKPQQATGSPSWYSPLRGLWQAGYRSPGSSPRQRRSTASRAQAPAPKLLRTEARLQLHLSGRAPVHWGA